MGFVAFEPVKRKTPSPLCEERVAKANGQGSLEDDALRLGLGASDAVSNT
jgi:hypothetical protein